jgi:hypothetical protein
MTAIEVLDHDEALSSLTGLLSRGSALGFSCHCYGSMSVTEKSSTFTGVSTPTSASIDPMVTGSLTMMLLCHNNR